MYCRLQYTANLWHTFGMNTSAVAFRIPTDLRKKATLRSRKLGIPLSFIVKNALADFVNGEQIVFSSAAVETLTVSPKLQARADAVAHLMERVVTARKK